MGDMVVESAVVKGSVIKTNGEKKEEKKKVPVSVRTDYIRGGIEGKYQKREGGTTIYYGPYMLYLGEKDIYRVDGARTSQVHFPLNMVGVTVPIKSGRLTLAPYVMYGQTGVDGTFTARTPFGEARSTINGTGDYGTLGINASYPLNDQRQTVVFGKFSTGTGTIQGHQSQTMLRGNVVAPAVDGLGIVYHSDWNVGASQNIAGSPGKPGSIRAAVSYGQKHDGIKWAGSTTTSDAKVYSLGLEWKASEDISVSGKVNMTNFDASGLSGPQSRNNIDYGFGVHIKF